MEESHQMPADIIMHWSGIITPQLEFSFQFNCQQFFILKNLAFLKENDENETNPVVQFSITLNNQHFLVCLT